MYKVGTHKAIAQIRMELNAVKKSTRFSNAQEDGA